MKRTMKKIIMTFALMITLGSLVGCSTSIGGLNKFALTGDTINITEDMYVTWVNEIYINRDDYIGKTVVIEGMYAPYFVEEEDTTYNLVYRVGPGCCGDDGEMCGFEFEYDGDLPEENDWIEVEGVLGYYEVDGNQYLTLKDSKMTVKDERGKEEVGV